MNRVDILVDDTQESEKKYTDGLKKTFIPTIFGVIGGVLSSIFAADSADSVALLMLILMIALQPPIYGFVDIEVKEFNQKDWVYTSAMTFLSWFVSWGILLNL
ncbi:MAG: hypothetical protein SVY15_06845 [Halobacteriota archaeon]|nr:hypothetical protein [Halobacteriota archaeon]